MKSLKNFKILFRYFKDDKLLLSTYIIFTVSKYFEFYKTIDNQVIERYENLKDGLSKTTFANSVVLYANHSNKAIESPLGEIEPYGYLWK